MAETKKSFVFYCSYAEQLALLPKETAADVVFGLCVYVGDGVKPDFEDPAAKMAFSFIAAQVDRDCSKWEAAAERRRNAAQNAAAARWKKAGTDASACARMPSDAINAPDAVNVDVDVDVSGNGIEKEKEGLAPAPAPKHTKFIKPDLEQIRLYMIKLKGDPAEAEKFFDHYESNSWRVGRSEMRNWQAAVRNWIRRSDTFKPVSPGIQVRKTTFSNFEQRDDDLDDMVQNAFIKKIQKEG